jgi:ATP-binding cassette subfamily C (CFTR/MRP) protein 1
LTPVSGDDDDAEFSDTTTTVTENLERKGSLPKARIFGVSSSDVSTPDLKKEHQEQGSVKMDVYKQYIFAASKIGFILYLFAIATQQATSVLASLTLRYWGEHNQKLGNNSGTFQYLLVYCLFSFSSSILGAASTITLWVYCAVRSARQIHDSVRSHNTL